ncbi:hypothetical protein FS837_009273 [Tulasnella sp. UAMH 9824]|nr:hypothetical protein FS837_009273 [Tulasnella sp. UAMH 9824]
MELLLDALRNSPSLERLELGRSPAECPSQTTVIPIHLPRLLALHLIFMPISVSNFLLTTIHAPNCSELLISSHFPKVLDDPVRDCLFTSSTNHFSPVIQTLLTRGRNKDIDITRSGTQTIEFLLNFHDEDCDDLLDRGLLRLSSVALSSASRTDSEMVDFIYGVVEEDKLQNEAALKMLRDRYRSNGSDSEDSSGGT